MMYSRLGANQIYPKPENLQKHSWYFGNISRLESEQMLLQQGKNEGTFLIRDAIPQTDPHSYRLSVLFWEHNRCVVHHYKIPVNILGCYYIDPEVTFSSLEVLVTWYRDRRTELPTKLSVPCPKQRIPPPGVRSTFLLKRSMITLETKLISDKDKTIDVWRGTLRSYAGFVAVKIQTSTSGNETRERLLREAKILHLLRHCNVISAIGLVETSPVCIVTQYHENNNLLEYVLNNCNTIIGYDITLRMAQEVAYALDYLSGMKYVHRNVRASNILLDREFTCKLTGFGFTVPLDQDGNYFVDQDDDKFDPAMYRWMAIEGAIEGRFTTASDVWSFGILLNEIFTKGELPYSNIFTPKVIENIRRGHRMKQKPCVPDDVYTLMTSCWVEDPVSRPTFKTVIATLEDLRASISRSSLKPLHGHQEVGVRPRYVPT